MSKLSVAIHPVGIFHPVTVGIMTIRIKITIPGAGKGNITHQR
ncbi:hypothetical protein OZH78_25715 [Escherichia coli]|nr:hypothetical protein [Escherichia coli]MCZ0496787.1 hypothetical protein [Escherichia coli]MCZ0515777.1 hypothetical protein [Escherichia coli]